MVDEAVAKKYLKNFKKIKVQKTRLLKLMGFLFKALDNCLCLI